LLTCFQLHPTSPSSLILVHQCQQKWMSLLRMTL
ncbi:hypothetical protein T07_4525, partial [Trichinella nelsoni]